MSKISDMYEQIKQQQYLLVKTKLEEAIKAMTEGKKLSKEEEQDYQFSAEDVSILRNLLKENKLSYHDVYDYDFPEGGIFIIKLNNQYITIDNGLRRHIPDILSLDEAKKVAYSFFVDEEMSEEEVKEDLEFREIDIEEELDAIANLPNIDLDSIVITSSDSKVQQNFDDDSIEVYEAKATEAKEDLVRAKLKQSIKDLMEGKKQSKDNSLYRDNQIYTLLNMLEEAGFQKGVDFLFEEEPFDYDSTVPELIIMIGDNLFHFSGITEIMTIQELEEYAREDDDDEFNPYADWLKLKPLDLEKLGIKIDTIERLEQTINAGESDKSIRDYLVDLKTYKVIEDKDSKIKADYVNTAGLQTVIYNLLRGVMIDTQANAKFNEGDNYCMIGEYSDMPGEEIISSVLNQVDRQVLETYFESYPEDIYLFDDMRKKYSEIKPLDEEFSKTTKDKFRREFEQSLFGSNLVEAYFFENPDALEAGFGEAVTRMEGFEQNMYDLWEHTLHTVESVDTKGLSPEDARILKIAAFFHDIGKPDVSSFNEKTGQQVFYGHAHKSVDVAKGILERLGYSEQEIQRIGFFIGHHDDFISYKSSLAPFMKNHEFIRGIDDSTIAEKIIENKYDFEAMGYNKDEIRTIVYTLAHGKEPDFRTKDGPISFPVDMEQVKKKMESGEYNAEYDATLEDYQMLLQLCRADARAQAEIVYDPKTGKETDSRKRKLDTFELIDNDMVAAFSKADTIINSISSRMTAEDKRTIEQYTGYSFEEFIQETKQLFKRPIMVMGDGSKISVQASAFHYCEPRRSGLDSYKSYEVSYPSQIIDQLRDYVETPVESDEELLESVYPNVPAELLSQIVMEHGGVDKEATLHPEKKLDGYKQEKAGMDDKTRKAQEMINQMMAQLGNIMEDYWDGNK